MKYMLFSMLFFPFFSFSQTKKVTQIDVKSEVIKLVSVIERKVPKQKAATGIGFTGSEIAYQRNYQSITLYYSTTGEKYLFVGEFYDVGANGWGEQCSVSNYDGMGCDGMPNMFQDYFNSWDKARQAKYLESYFQELKKWHQVLK